MLMVMMLLVHPLFQRITNTNKFKITLPNNISYSANPLSTVINSTVNVSITNPIQSQGS